MGNKQVTDRRGSTELVAAAAETHAARIQEGVRAALGGHLGKKESLPDIGLAVVLLARAIRGASDTLVKASDAYDAELADDAAPRDARDAATATLVDILVTTRGTLGSLYGAAGLRALGIDGHTPSEPKAVASHAGKLARALRDPKVKLPAAARKGVKIDREALAEEIDEPLAVLEKALKDVSREAREAQAASDAKSKAMAANDDLFGRAATFISAALALVGDDDLAARVRPVGRRPGTAAGAEDAAGGERGGDGGEPAKPKADAWASVGVASGRSPGASWTVGEAPPRRRGARRTVGAWRPAAQGRWPTVPRRTSGGQGACRTVRER